MGEVPRLIRWQLAQVADKTGNRFNPKNCTDGNIRNNNNNNNYYDDDDEADEDDDDDDEEELEGQEEEEEDAWKGENERLLYGGRV